MARHIEFTTRDRPGAAPMNPLRTGLVAAMLVIIAGASPGHAGDGDRGAMRHASLTQATLALNQDLAREYARGEQLLHAADRHEPAPRWQASTRFKPRNQAMLYPAGDDGVMLELNIQY